MIKTSVVKHISVDDVRRIPHLTCIGMMASDILNDDDKFDYFDREDFIKLINNYTMRCDPLTNSIEYFINGAPHKRVIIAPGGLDGIYIEYYLGMSKKVVTWSYDNYAELADDWTFDDEDEERYK